MTLTYNIADVAPYINWLYFDHAWGMSGKPEAERQQLRREAEERLSRYADRYHSRALFQLFDCYSEGEDIVLSVGGTGARGHGGARIPCLRQQQQGSDYLSLADFIAPRSALDSNLVPPSPRTTVPPSPRTTVPQSPRTTVPPTGSTSVSPGKKIGVFATTVDTAIVTDFEADPYEKMMMQLVADRLAEATAERLHEQVRKEFWGYAADEQLTIAEMQQERFQGIRPAVGYPSLPDTSLNFVLDTLLGFSQIGIRLTESGAMRPHASVSGLMLAHPQARYFSIGKIGDDQLRDYAQRRGVPVELMRKFLTPNL